jgi:hypothetical protein
MVPEALEAWGYTLRPLARYTLLIAALLCSLAPTIGSSQQRQEPAAASKEPCECPPTPDCPPTTCTDALNKGCFSPQQIQDACIAEPPDCSNPTLAAALEKCGGCGSSAPAAGTPTAVESTP